jgi:hypothetical protein
VKDIQKIFRAGQNTNDVIRPFPSPSKLIFIPSPLTMILRSRLQGCTVAALSYLSRPTLAFSTSRVTSELLKSSRRN